MKQFLFLFSLMFAVGVKAEVLNWNDLEADQNYILRQDIVFENGVILKKGSSFLIEDILSEEVYFNLQTSQEGCEDPALETEMILVNPSLEENSHDRSVGLRLETGCRLQIYLEPQDYYSQSLFSNK